MRGALAASNWHVCCSLGHDTSLFPRLVLSCIDADRNEKWRIFQHFSRSTRKSPSRKQILQISANFLHNFGKFFQKFSNFQFCKIFEKLSKNLQNFAKFLQICLRESDFRVDLEKCEKMRIWTRKSALIQPRTNLGKSDGSWLMRSC